MIVTFEPLQQKHFPLLLKWLQTPHVKEWWDTDVPWTMGLVQEKYGAYTQGYKLEDDAKKPINGFIIVLNGKEVGYIQLYNAYGFPREDDIKSDELPKSLAAIDIFIGEESYLGKGLSFIIMNQFLKTYVDPYYEACFVDPDSANIAAIRAYEKVGFQYLKTTKHSQWLVRKKMTEHLIFRRLVKEDLNDFFSLRLESLLDFPTAFLASYDEEKKLGASLYEKALNNNINNLVFGAFVEKKLIGFIGIYQEERQKTNHKSNIWGMYVQTDYRSQGIGKALLENAVTYAKNTMKSLIVNISVEATNISAKKLYESYGFKVWGTEPKAMQINGNFYTEFHMALII